MTDVKHMKWWGWGRDGVSFHWEDKPAFPAFLKMAIGVDLQNDKAGTPPGFDDITVPGSRASAAFLKKLAAATGDAYVTTDDLDRVVHTFGKSIRDLIRVRAGDLVRTPDVVVYPADEAEVQAVVAAAVAEDAVIIPFGGGSNIVGSLEPLGEELRPVISLDMGRMNRVLDIDTQSGLARIQAGAQGPDLEEELLKAGWTIGHFPDSFTHSTVGGWVATRSSGMQSDKYGDIADITRGLRVVRPEGVLVIRPVPSASTGPSVREMILGSEGRLGIITEVTVQVHRIPEKRVIQAYFYPNWDAGLAAMQGITESDAVASVTRVSDAKETMFFLATAKEAKGLSALAPKVLERFMKIKGWDTDQICLSFVGFEGSPATVARNKKLADAVVKKHGGFGVGTSIGVLYDQKKFDTPYIRDFLLDRGGSADVSETSAPWSKLPDLYRNVMANAEAAFDEMKVQGWIMCHLSHSYHTGACLYFTFAYIATADPIEQYEVIKNSIQQTFIDSGATVSHHHGVGLEHAPWMEQDISSQGVAVMQGLFESADPGNNFNPGKVISSAPIGVVSSR